jgi:hypothetical protein
MAASTAGQFSLGVLIAASASCQFLPTPLATNRIQHHADHELTTCAKYGCTLTTTGLPLSDASP